MEVVILHKDIAKLVLDYLLDNNLISVAKKLCKHSDHLQEEHQLISRGLMPSSLFRSKLVDLIQDYQMIKSVVSEFRRKSPPSMQKIIDENDTLLSQLECILKMAAGRLDATNLKRSSMSANEMQGTKRARSISSDDSSVMSVSATKATDLPGYIVQPVKKRRMSLHKGSSIGNSPVSGTSNTDESPADSNNMEASNEELHQVPLLPEALYNTILENSGGFTDKLVLNINDALQKAQTPFKNDVAPSTSAAAVQEGVGSSVGGDPPWIYPSELEKAIQSVMVVTQKDPIFEQIVLEALESQQGNNNNPGNAEDSNNYHQPQRNYVEIISNELIRPSTTDGNQLVSLDSLNFPMILIRDGQPVLVEGNTMVPLQEGFQLGNQAMENAMVFVQTETAQEDSMLDPQMLPIACSSGIKHDVLIEGLPKTTTATITLAKTPIPGVNPKARSMSEPRRRSHVRALTFDTPKKRTTPITEELPDALNNSLSAPPKITPDDNGGRTPKTESVLNQATVDENSVTNTPKVGKTAKSVRRRLSCAARLQPEEGDSPSPEIVSVRKTRSKTLMEKTNSSPVVGKNAPQVIIEEQNVEIKGKESKVSMTPEQLKVKNEMDAMSQKWQELRSVKPSEWDAHLRDVYCKEQIELYKPKLKKIKKPSTKEDKATVKVNESVGIKDNKSESVTKDAVVDVKSCSKKKEVEDPKTKVSAPKSAVKSRRKSKSVPRESVKPGQEKIAVPIEIVESPTVSDPKIVQQFSSCEVTLERVNICPQIPTTSAVVVEQPSSTTFDPQLDSDANNSTIAPLISFQPAMPSLDDERTFLTNAHSLSNLMTPFKFDDVSLLFPQTPRLLPIGTNDTPLTKLLKINDISDSMLKNPEFPTPTFPITPNISSLTPFLSKEKSEHNSPRSGGVYSNRPTDYSSGGSYYRPDETDDVDLNPNTIMENRVRRRKESEAANEQALEAALKLQSRDAIEVNSTKDELVANVGIGIEQKSREQVQDESEKKLQKPQTMVLDSQKVYESLKMHEEQLKDSAEKYEEVKKLRQDLKEQEKIQMIDAQQLSTRQSSSEKRSSKKRRRSSGSQRKSLTIASPICNEGPSTIKQFSSSQIVSHNIDETVMQTHESPLIGTTADKGRDTLIVELEEGKFDSQRIPPPCVSIPMSALRTSESNDSKMEKMETEIIRPSVRNDSSLCSSSSSSASDETSCSSSSSGSSSSGSDTDDEELDRPHSRVSVVSHNSSRNSKQSTSRRSSSQRKTPAKQQIYKTPVKIVADDDKFLPTDTDSDDSFKEIIRKSKTPLKDAENMFNSKEKVLAERHMVLENQRMSLEAKRIRIMNKIKSDAGPRFSPIKKKQPLLKKTDKSSACTRAKKPYTRKPVAATPWAFKKENPLKSKIDEPVKLLDPMISQSKDLPGTSGDAIKKSEIKDSKKASNTILESNTHSPKDQPEISADAKKPSRSCATNNSSNKTVQSKIVPTDAKPGTSATTKKSTTNTKKPATITDVKKDALTKKPARSLKITSPSRLKKATSRSRKLSPKKSGRNPSPKRSSKNKEEKSNRIPEVKNRDFSNKVEACIDHSIINEVLTPMHFELSPVVKPITAVSEKQPHKSKVGSKKSSETSKSKSSRSASSQSKDPKKSEMTLASFSSSHQPKNNQNSNRSSQLSANQDAEVASSRNMNSQKSTPTSEASQNLHTPSPLISSQLSEYILQPISSQNLDHPMQLTQSHTPEIVGSQLSGVSSLPCSLSSQVISSQASARSSQTVSIQEASTVSSHLGSSKGHSSQLISSQSSNHSSQQLIGSQASGHPSQNVSSQAFKNSSQHISSQYSSQNDEQTGWTSYQQESVHIPGLTPSKPERISQSGPHNPQSNLESHKITKTPNGPTAIHNEQQAKMQCDSNQISGAPSAQHELPTVQPDDIIEVYSSSSEFEEDSDYEQPLTMTFHTQCTRHVSINETPVNRVSTPNELANLEKNVLRIVINNKQHKLNVADEVTIFQTHPNRPQQLQPPIVELEHSLPMLTQPTPTKTYSPPQLEEVHDAPSNPSALVLKMPLKINLKGSATPYEVSAKRPKKEEKASIEEPRPFKNLTSPQTPTKAAANKLEAANTETITTPRASTSSTPLPKLNMAITDILRHVHGDNSK